jgi:outer membrane protein assembly factor BamB
VVFAALILAVPYATAAKIGLDLEWRPIEGIVPPPSQAADGHELSPSPLRKKWSTRIESFEKDAWGSFNVPTILNDRIYGAINKQIFALDIHTGSIVWKRELSWWVHQNTQLEVTQGRVWVGTGGKAYKIDATTGSVLWETALPDNGVVNMTRYYKDKVLVLGRGGLYMLYDNGQMAWHNDSIGGDGFAIHNGCVYVGRKWKEGQQSHMLAVDIDTGKVVREFATASWARWAPTLHLGTLYFVDTADVLYALDINNWTLRWKIRLEGRTYSPPVIKNGTLYIATDRTYAIDATSGNIRWSQPYGEGMAAPFVGEDGLYVIGQEYTADRVLSDAMPNFRGAEELASELDDSSAVRLQSRLEKQGYKGQVLKEGYGFLSFLYWLDIHTGRVLWKERIPLLTESNCTPTEVDGTVYIGSNDGLFHAYKITR